jgi:hypothetical protein
VLAEEMAQDHLTSAILKPLKGKSRTAGILLGPDNPGGEPENLTCRADRQTEADRVAD